LKSQQQQKKFSIYSGGWTKAKTDLLKLSPNIIRAEHRVQDSMTARLRLWKNFVPSLTATLTDSATVAEIGTLFADSSLRVSSFFSFGDVVSLPKQVAGLQLSQMGAEWQAEQAMRNEVIALYRIFREKQLLQKNEQALRERKEFLDETVLDKSSIDYIAAHEAIDKSIAELERANQSWIVKFSDLHQIRYSEVNLSFSDLPDILYDPADLDFSDSSRWGVLEMNLLALESIANDARLSETMRRYYPTPNLGVTAPPLFSSSSSSSFQLEDFRITPSLNWRLDTRGFISEQVNRIKREKPFRDWALDKRTASEVAKLLEGKRALAEVQKEISLNRKATEEYAEFVSEGLVENIEAAMLKLQQAKEEELALMAKEIDICSSLWFIDERRWKQTTKEWRVFQNERLASRPKPWYRKAISKLNIFS
jgi:hypothetical protein